MNSKPSWRSLNRVLAWFSNRYLKKMTPYICVQQHQGRASSAQEQELNDIAYQLEENREEVILPEPPLNSSCSFCGGYFLSAPSLEIPSKSSSPISSTACLSQGDMNVRFPSLHGAKI